MAQEVGRWLAAESAIRAQFLAELFAQPHPMRAFECGLGLAEGADNLNAIWLELAASYAASGSATRDARLLGGFICGVRQRDPSFTSAALEAAIDDPELAPVLPYLQACAGIDAAGIARLRRAIAKGALVAPNFRNIANGSVSNSPPNELAALLEDIGTLSGGLEIALEVLHMHFYSNKEETRNVLLVSVGRDLLARATFNRENAPHDFGTHTVAQICLSGDDGRRAAEKVCSNICAALDRYELSPHNVSYIYKALLETQPFVTLDAFLLSPSPYGIRDRFDLDFQMGPSIETVDPAILLTWANVDPDTRYPLLGKCLRIFRKKNHEEQNDISPLFLSMLNQAPDKRLFLGNPWDRVFPRSGSGSFTHALIQRKAQVMKLAEHADAEVRAWAGDAILELDRWIERERRRDRESEQSFE
jgi:hypothetical protein